MSWQLKKLPCPQDWENSIVILTRRVIWVSVATSVGAILVVGVFLRYQYLLQGQSPTRERLLKTATGSDPHYDPIQYRAKDSRPAIMEPEFADGDSVRLAGGTMGIGVSVGGDSRFYPLYILQYHQVLNDECGGKSIVCSY